MRKIESVDELKKIQLGILVSFHQFCSDNNIKYSLAAGSLIGAVRHKGFIPWDDDIDVYLLREDYNKLVELFPNVYNEKYSLITLERDSQWHRTYGKLYDLQTIEVEDVRNKFHEIGIGIDVFPIDDAPDEEKEWQKYNRKRMFLRDVITIKSMTYSADRGILKNAIMLISRILLTPFSFSFLCKTMNLYAQKYNNKGTNHVYENCLGVYNSKHPWLKKDFDQVIDSPFEEYNVKIMKGYDDYLSCVYGDYMQLPPEEKRISTHTITAWWK